MPLNWQLKQWPHFNYVEADILSLEEQFLQGAEGPFAILKYLNDYRSGTKAKFYH